MQKGLGRGLNAFFGEDQEEVKSATGEKKKLTELDKVIELDILEVEPMLNQPRKKFDEEKLQELSDSIKEQGVLQPILVVKGEDGYTIVAGERRWRAAKQAGLKKIPAIIKDYTDTKKKQVALIENIQREDLNVVEIAKAIKELMDIDGFSQTEVAKITGKNLSTISNIIRLLKLEDDILDFVLEGKLVEGQARALLAVEDEEKRLFIAKKAVEKKLTVRDVERLVYESEDYKRKPSKRPQKTMFFKKVEERLDSYFGYKTKLDMTKKNQRLIIEYKDNEGLESIIEKLNIKI